MKLQFIGVDFTLAILYFTQPAVPRRNGWYHGTTSNRGRYTHNDRRRSCFPNSPSLLGFSLLASRWVTQFEKLSRDGAIEQNIVQNRNKIFLLDVPRRG